MTLLGLIALIAIVCLIAWLATKIPAPAPFNWIIQLVVVLVLIWVLFSALGFGDLGLNSRIR